MSRQSRPSGTFDRVTIGWKLRVRARLDELGMSRAELARMVGVKPAAISQLLGSGELRPVESSTKLKPAIQKALGLREDAGVEDADDLRERFLKALPSLDETQRAIIDAAISVAAKRS